MFRRALFRPRTALSLSRFCVVRRWRCQSPPLCPPPPGLDTYFLFLRRVRYALRRGARAGAEVLQAWLGQELRPGRGRRGRLEVGCSARLLRLVAPLDCFAWFLHWVSPLFVLHLVGKAQLFFCREIATGYPKSELSRRVKIGILEVTLATPEQSDPRSVVIGT